MKNELLKDLCTNSGKDRLKRDLECFESVFHISMGKESENNSSSDYFKRLFGNITKGGLGLFLNNPFQRKPESDSQQTTDVDVNETFEQGGIKHKAKKGQSLEAEVREVKDDETNKHLGQAKRKTEAVSEGNENSGEGKRKAKVIRDNDENLQHGTKRIKDDSENDVELDPKKNKKKADSKSNENVVPRKNKKKADSKSNENVVPRQKEKNAESEIQEARSHNDDSSVKMKKKKKAESEIQEARIHNDDSSGKTKKKKKAESEIQEAKIHNDDSSGKTKKKKKEKLSEERSAVEEILGSSSDKKTNSSYKIHAEEYKKDSVQKEKKRKDDATEELVQTKEVKKRKDDATEELVQTKEVKKRKDDATEELVQTKEVKKRKDDATEELVQTKEVKKRKEDATEELVQTKEVKKRKQDAIEGLVQRKEEKKGKALLAKNHKLQEAEADEVQEMPGRRQGKRTIEQEEINGPNKKRKFSHLNSHNFESELDKGLIVYSGEQADPKRKSDLRKRKRDVLEEEYQVRHGLQVDETASKKGAISKKTLGKRKRGDDEEDMFVKKQAFDDGEKLHRTIFIGNLPLSLKRKHLIKEFSQFGEVESVRLRSVPILDSKLPRKNAILKGQIDDSHNRVHAYVVFKDEQSANAALSHNLAELGGNHIRVDRAYPPCKKFKGENHFTYDYTRTVFVGNLPFDVKDEELYQLFIGTKPLESSVEAVRVIRDPHTSKGKGIAYVLFKTMNAAKLAIKKNHFKLRDRDLRLSKARPDSHQESRAVSTPGSWSDMNPRIDGSSGKRPAESGGPSNLSAIKKSRVSLSYQGTKASKMDGRPVKVTGAAIIHRDHKSDSIHANDPKSRQFKRPAVAARKATLSKSPGPNHTSKKRKQVEARTGYSKSPKKFRAD